MRSITTTAISLLTEGRLIVGAAAAAITVVTAHALGTTAAPQLLWTVFASTVLIYDLDRICDRRGEAVGVPRTVWSTLILAGITLLVSLPQLRSETVLAVLSGLPLCALYAIPIPRLRGARPKDHPVGKVLFVAVAVTIATVFLPLLEGFGAGDLLNLPAGRFLLAGGWVFLAILGNAIACDLRDLPHDLPSGLRTLPAILGSTGTRSLLITANVIFLVACACAIAFGELPIETILPFAMALIALRFLRNHHPRWCWSLALDGAFLSMLLVFS